MKTFILSSGGTGGHVFPAISLAEELHKRGHRVVMVTDQRGEFFQDFPHFDKVYTLDIKRKNGLIKLASVTLALWSALRIVSTEKPAAIIGFGGYPSIPAVLAGQLKRCITVIHEQNAILGRTNKFLCRFATKLAVAFPFTRHIPKNKTPVIVGNPVRSAIIEASKTPYSPPTDTFRLLVIGGSQGASVFSKVLPKAIALLSDELRNRLELVQQCRPELLTQTTEAYNKIGINFVVQPFFDDIPTLIANAHLIISRAGAMTISEVSIIGRPTLFVPLPSAMDDHQTENARLIQQEGGGWIIPENQLSPDSLARLLEKIMNMPNDLMRRSQKIRRVMRENAAQKLADVVENLVS